jgi:putative transposase
MYNTSTEDGPVIEALHDYSAHYFKYGARRVQIFLYRNSAVLGRDRALEISAAAGLQVPSKSKKSKNSATNQLEPAV